MTKAKNIEELIKKLRYDASSQMYDRIFDNVLQAQKKSEQQKSAVIKPNIWRMIMKSRITKLAAAAVVLMPIIIGMYYFTGSGTSVAFANAMEHFVTAQTARFDLSIEFGEQEPQTSSFLYDTKGYIRQNMANGTVNFVDYNRKKVHSLVPDTKTAVIRDVSKPDFHTALYNIFTKLQDLIQQAIDLGHGPVESLGTKIIDGNTAYGYRVETTGQSPGLYWNGKGTLTIWADAETDFPLILKWHNSMTNIIVTVSNIQLNVIFSPDELSITIPDGYIIRDETLAVTEPQNEEDFIRSDEVSETEPEHLMFQEPLRLNVADLIEGLEKNDQTLIKLFHSWAFLAKGKFPSSLTVDAIKDIDPDAKINFKQRLWSTEISAQMPNLFGDWKPDIDPNDYTQEEMLKDKQGPYYQEVQKQVQEHMQTYTPHFGNIADGFKLINELPANSDWYYSGQEATLSDTNTAIFWYKPNGTEFYRVIYGDLSIEDIDQKDLHLLETPSDVEIDRQANAVLEAAIQLGANIPKDKRNKVFRMLSLKEKDLIKGLATYLEYSDGRYPPSMIIDESFIKDIEALFSEASNQGRIDKKTREEKIFDLFYAGSFYNKLIREKKEPVYYGATSTISKPNDVLVRWKLSKNKYRVIYGDLTFEDIAPEDLPK